MKTMQFLQRHSENVLKVATSSSSTLAGPALPGRLLQFPYCPEFWISFRMSSKRTEKIHWVADCSISKDPWPSSWSPGTPEKWVDCTSNLHHCCISTVWIYLNKSYCNYWPVWFVMMSSPLGIAWRLQLIFSDVGAKMNDFQGMKWSETCNTTIFHNSVGQNWVLCLISTSLSSVVKNYLRPHRDQAAWNCP